ncbi:MAG: 4-oxalomesaconate tautomerase [Pseudomonadota bacterium]
MRQAAIPFLLMRGGTSRGPYFCRSDLPEDREQLSKALIAVMGANHPLNIDGVGGGSPVTTKVAMLSASDHPDADIDFFFAQVDSENGLVDFKPTCGNILVGVGPAAIEMGMIAFTGDETTVRIRAANTGAFVDALVETSNGAVNYDGDVEIDGVPGVAAPVRLTYKRVMGAATGALLPTGSLRDVIDGVQVTCMDVAMPVVVARAEDLGLTGYETAQELDADVELLARIEPIRREAGRRMRMGDVSRSVTPKFAVVAPARKGGSFSGRYFMPWKCHPSMAVTGGQCLAACALTPGSVADGLLDAPAAPARIAIEHPSGVIDLAVDYALDAGALVAWSASVTRTARCLARGEVFVPSAVLAS